MQFQIPQFIDIENKIVGPLTLKQFLYLAAAGGLDFLLFFVLATWLWVFIAAIIAGIGLALAFGKYNGQSLPKIGLYAFGFMWKPRRYFWQREIKQKTIQISSIGDQRRDLKNYLPQMPNVKKLWVDLMTSKAPIPKREKSASPHWGRQPKEKFEVLKKITGDKEIARRVDYR